MKTVFFDIDTQNDFALPSGALYVAGAEAILPVIIALNRRAAATGLPLISTTDAHAEDDPEFKVWPPHCVAGTLGQRKAAGTLLDRQVIVPTAGPVPDVSGAPQIIVEKQQLDCFSNPYLPAVIERLGADRYVVYGVVTEYCVRCAAMGLLRTGKPVELVTDAVRSLSDEASRKMIDEFTAGGGRVTTAATVLG